MDALARDAGQLINGASTMGPIGFLVPHAAVNIEAHATDHIAIVMDVCIVKQCRNMGGIICPLVLHADHFIAKKLARRRRDKLIEQTV